MPGATDNTNTMAFHNNMGHNGKGTRRIRVVERNGTITITASSLRPPARIPSAVSCGLQLGERLEPFVDRVRTDFARQNEAVKGEKS